MSERVKLVEVYKKSRGPRDISDVADGETVGNHILLLVVRGARLGPVVFTTVGNSG